MFIPDAKPDRVTIAETPDINALLNGYKGKEVAAQKAAFENTIPNFIKHTEYGALQTVANMRYWKNLPKEIK